MSILLLRCFDHRHTNKSLASKDKRYNDLVKHLESAGAVLAEHLLVAPTPEDKRTREDSKGGWSKIDHALYRNARTGTCSITSHDIIRGDQHNGSDHYVLRLGYTAANRPSGSREVAHCKKRRLGKQELEQDEVAATFCTELDIQLDTNVGNNGPANLGDMMAAFDAAVTAATDTLRDLHKENRRRKPLFTPQAQKLLVKVRQRQQDIFNNRGFLQV